MFRAIDTSTSGLVAERFRLDVISNNIANMETTRQPDGSIGPYRRRIPVFLPGGVGIGDEQGVHVAEVYKDQSDFKQVYRPGHPDANEDGIVLMPNVDVAIEMTDVVAAVRAYQANVTAMNASKQLLMNSLELIS